MHTIKLAGVATGVAWVALSAASAQQAVQPMPAETTAARVTDPSWKAPRTSWGHPSLEGTWTTDDMRSIPYERPEELGHRAELTPGEFAARAKSNANDLDRSRNRQTFSGRNDVGIRSFGYTSLVVDPPNGRLPPMTDAARARRDIQGTYGPGPYNGPEDFTLYDRCITRGILGGALPVSYGNGMRIVQTPTSVAIGYEMIHDTRIIDIDGRPHLDDGLSQYLGSSRGYWDGETLVVETQNLTDQTSFGRNGRGPRHSTAMKMTERFTRIDPDMIEYVITAEDPEAYTAPFTVRFMYTTQPSYRIFEYSCHEGNTAVSHGLSGERAYEREVAEALAKGLPIPARRSASDGLGPLPEDDADYFDVNAGE